MNEESFCGNTLFITLAKLCEEICSLKSHDKKTQLMSKFIKSYRQQSKHKSDDNFYPILRLILPQLDRSRSAYGIKESTLAQMYIRILCISKDSNDAQKLINYRSPKFAGNDVGDFADVAYWVIKSRCASGGIFTVSQLNGHLDAMAQHHESHNPRGIDEELQTIFLKMSALEQKWFIRILLKDTKLKGLSNNKILEIFHQDALALYDVTNDLKEVCEKLKDENAKLNEIDISLFRPFRPMLSQRCDLQYIERDLRKQEFYLVENKYDGERFQLHYKEGQFKYYSRRGFDYTEVYGSNASNGILTPLLAQQLNAEVDSCILDGEMMCWNANYKSFTTKGMNIDVKKLRLGNVHRPCFCVFDILMYNDDVITNRPLVQRIKILDEIFETKEGVIMQTQQHTVKTGSEIMNWLNTAIDDREEGIIVKEPTSVYKPNSRNCGWYKIKPEYTKGIMVELDLLVIGGYYGGGGNVSHFLLGVAVDDDEGHKIFQSCGRIGSGFTKEDLMELRLKLHPHWKRLYSNQTQPTQLQWTKEKPDLWIKPEDSVILQVMATEVVPSDAFKVGYSLRFPRIQSVRYDKPWFDCLKLDEFKSIIQKTCGKLRAKHVEKLASPEIKEKRRKKVIKVEDEYCMQKMTSVHRLSNIFDGLEICLMIIPVSSKRELEKRVVQHGGTVTQNPGNGTYCVVTNDEGNIRVRNIISLKQHNVAKIDWIVQCFSRVELIQWSPEYLISTTEDVCEKLSNEFDRFGDSYYKNATISSLKIAMQNTDEKEGITREQMVELDKELFEHGNPYGIFRTCVGYFQKVNDFFNEDEMHFKFLGGMITEDIRDEEMTHVIMYSSDLNIMELCDDLNKGRKNRSIFVVTRKWVQESYKMKKRQLESSYKIQCGF